MPPLAGRKTPTNQAPTGGSTGSLIPQSSKKTETGGASIVQPPSNGGSTKVPLSSATIKPGSSLSGSSAGRLSPVGGISRDSFSGSSRDGTRSGYFINSDRSSRLHVSISRHRDNDGYFFGGHKKDYYCGCHRPYRSCHIHSHSSFWMGFGFCSSYYSPYYPVYPVYPVYTWPVYETIVVPTYVAAPVAVPSAVGYYGQPAPGVEVQTPGAYATVPPGQETPQQAPPAEAQQQPAEPQPQQQTQPLVAPSATQSEGLPTEEMDRLMKEGVEAFGNGNYEQAAQNFMKVSMAVPDNIDALLAYAVARFATGDYANSATAIRRAVRKVPDVVNSLFDLRDRYGKMSDFDRHVANLVRHVNEKKDDIDGWIVLGFVQHFIADRPHAKQTFEGIKKRSPSDADVADIFLNAKPLDQLVKEAQEAAKAEQESAPSEPDGQMQSNESQPGPVGEAAPEAPPAPAPAPAAPTLQGDFSEPFGTAPETTRPARANPVSVEQAVQVVSGGEGN